MVSSEHSEPIKSDHDARYRIWAKKKQTRWTQGLRSKTSKDQEKQPSLENIVNRQTGYLTYSEEEKKKTNEM